MPRLSCGRIARKEKRELNRKLFATAMMVMTILIQACSSAATTAPSSAPSSTAPASTTASTAPATPAAPVTLTLWHNYGIEANAKVTEALIKAYMAAHPERDVPASSPSRPTTTSRCSRRPRSPRPGRTS